MAKTLKQIQKKTGDWVVRNGGHWSHFEQLAALVEECGELAKELHHLHGSKKKFRAKARPCRTNWEICCLSWRAWLISATLIWKNRLKTP